MGRGKTQDSAIQKMEKVTTPYIARFINYMYTPEDKRKPWDEFKTCHEYIKPKTYDECMEWLTREDAQKALQVYQKHMKLFNLNRLYDSMLEKALNGDTRAAAWVENFTKSDFFDESNDEIDDFLSGINIPGLEK